MAKIISSEKAVALVKDNMTIAVGGFIGCGIPEELLVALEERYLKTQTPRDLTLFHCAAVGDGGQRGANHLGHEGLLKKLICGHIGLEPMLNKLVVENKIPAFLLPQGVTCHLTRAIGGKKPGVLTHVGLKTFADPRLEGCKVNQAAYDCNEEVVSLVNIEGKDYLLYRYFPIDICFIKGSIADTDGNISLEKEAAVSEQMDLANATRNSGGIVVAQVEKIVQPGSLKAHDVKVHGFMVDYLVVGRPENNIQVWTMEGYHPELSGEFRVPVEAIQPMPLNHRKICGRRGALELKKNCLINLGLGVPDAVAAVAGEEEISDYITLSIESGVLGGVPLGGNGLGATVNPEAIYKQPDTFDVYDGGGVDMSFLGAAEIDEKGNVNVSKFGGRVVGPGGFIDISQNTPNMYFTGTFTSGGLKTQVKDGKLHITHEGKNIKFVKKVEQVTFSAEYAMETGQKVLYITERAVFQLTDKGLKLIEVAPGIDIKKDILPYMEFKPIIENDVKLMDERIFREEKMGLGFDD